MPADDTKASADRSTENTIFDRRRLIDGQRVQDRAPVAPDAAPDAAPDPSIPSSAAPVAPPREREIAGNVSVVIGMAFFLVIVFGPGIYDLLGLKDDRMVMVTAATMQQDTTWRLSGRVLVDGAPTPARVWAIATDDQGNRFAPPSVLTDAAGAYAFAPVPARITPASETLARRVVSSPDSLRLTSEVTVYARSLGNDSTAIGRVSETVRLGPSARTRWVKLPPSALLTVIAIFVLSIVAGIAQGKPGGILRKLQYYGNVILAFLLTGTVVALISLGLRHVNLTGTQGDVIALGFANIYKGSYVKDVAPEWLFSLTAPWQGTATDTVTRGFGVPLWALLLACFGAGVFTVRLVVKQIRTPVRLTDDRQFRSRLQELVRHQFYILFAPVAAVFVYQLLVAAGAASQPTTVAFAMLAAGLVLNNVLDRAVIAARGALETDDPVGGKNGGAHGTGEGDPPGGGAGGKPVHQPHDAVAAAGGGGA